MGVDLLWLIPLGFAVGAYGTIIGAGGGFLLVPILLFVYPDYEPERITAISLAMIWANATSGSIAYARQRRIDYVTGTLFAASSVPGVIGGALLVHLVPEDLFSVLFGFLMLAVSIVFFLRFNMPIKVPLRGRGVLVRTVVTSRGETYRYAYRVWVGVVLSIAVGFASSLFGIGGGIIHVPAMIMLLSIPIQFAVATSHFTLAFMAGGGTIVHLIDGSLAGKQLLQALMLGIGAIIGAQAGAQIAHRIQGQTVTRLLAIALVALSIRLLVKGLLDF